MTKKITKQDWWLLILWVAIGFCLRFGNLTLKPMWGDEWATLVFSLGSGFKGIPFDQLMSSETLLAPVKFDAANSLNSVTSSLLSESNHPPLYFWLTHLWLRLWSTDQQYISIWVGRSLSALFGTLLIPLGFWLGWFCFRARRLAHFCSLVIALSPFAVYLSQEARHYSLALIFVSLSLGCLVALIREIKTGRSPSFLLLVVWLVVNGFGIASHFFMVLHILVEGLVLLRFYVEDVQRSLFPLRNTKTFLTRIFIAPWRRIMVGLLANVTLILILLDAWSGNSDSKLTSWLNKDYGWSLEAIAPVGRLILWLWGMVFNFPLEVQSQFVVIPSAIAFICLFLWLSPQLFRAVRNVTTNLESRILLNVIGASLLTFLGLIYIGKLDVSLTPRYQFIYLPAVLLLFATTLEHFWQQQKKRSTALIIALMLVGSLAVNFDTAYRKPENIKSFTTLMTTYTTDKSLVIGSRDHRAAEIRMLMGIAWDLRQKQIPRTPHFFVLDHDTEDIAPMLDQVKDALNQDFELWMINTSTLPSEATCIRQPEPRQGIPGSLYRRYICQ
ncbi:hypothetical protein Lepto7376_0548 [[Leptolyngbya] sp. PCC 7376]|uniref:glycosyltransferase family 39 protein n=1 Tax=[Leptolyngbya] sp. PCC 7376 TaxID=111781 RepID=UPI00029ED888|nr:hypothetical protein [[Leptolyngbya] sp. PCC 7376]AFY36974.1 hypothetical protein Lepto7376_0548 [[Leptolyngbya] sp. PCC 7376]